MAQVNSEPGVSQVPPTVVVSTATSEVGATAAKAKAAITTVSYTQIEPGKTVNPTRM